VSIREQLLDGNPSYESDRDFVERIVPNIKDSENGNNENEFNEYGNAKENHRKLNAVCAVPLWRSHTQLISTFISSLLNVSRLFPVSSPLTSKVFWCFKNA
jgi:hypothetical protein